MANSLRDEVEVLAAEWEYFVARRTQMRVDCLIGSDYAAKSLREILSRHPPAVWVVVPVALLKELRRLAHDTAIDATFPEDAQRASGIVAQADAILSEAGV
jgi:hypothetical protein